MTSVMELAVLEQAVVMFHHPWWIYTPQWGRHIYLSGSHPSCAKEHANCNLQRILTQHGFLPHFLPVFERVSPAIGLIGE